MKGLELKTGIENLDELAADLGVLAITGLYEGILLMGKSGQYGLVELLMAHVKLMQQSLDRGRDCGFDDLVR